jgi:uncharacterized BrkB/YihY/UPF0761 family membrane protein
MPTRPRFAMMVRIWELWNDHNAARLAAALACYSILSVAPLVVPVDGCDRIRIWGQN